MPEPALLHEYLVRAARRAPDKTALVCDERRWTYAELDRQTELSPGTIGRIERQEQRVYASHLYRISQQTGVSIHYFYGADTDNAAPSTSAEQETQRLLDAYMHIKDPVTKRDVYELIKSIADEIVATPTP